MDSLVVTLLKTVIVLLVSVQNTPSVDVVSTANVIKFANESVVYAKKVLDKGVQSSGSYQNNQGSNVSYSNQNTSSVSQNNQTDISSSTTVIASDGAHPVVSASIGGRVTISPTCPVQTIENDCVKPLASTTVYAYATSTEGNQTFETKTDSNGRYMFSLSPGKYNIVVDYASGLKRGSLPSKYVELNGPTGADIDFQIDSGMR